MKSLVTRRDLRMNVRPFQLSDYSAVKELMAQVLSEDCCEETMLAFARQLSMDSELVLVAQLNHQVVGLIIGTVDNHRAYYYRIAVAKEHQRKGIGKALIAKMQQRFQTRRVSKILVTADSHNEAILPLYESLGYASCDKSIHKLKIVNG
jgi:ribosomal protein S18 acetylase RimI-like enzyme